MSDKPNERVKPKAAFFEDIKNMQWEARLMADFDFEEIAGDPKRIIAYYEDDVLTTIDGLGNIVRYETSKLQKEIEDLIISANEPFVLKIRLHEAVEKIFNDYSRGRKMKNEGKYTSYIVFEKNSFLVKEYPNGEIVPLKDGVSMQEEQYKDEKLNNELINLKRIIEEKIMNSDEPLELKKRLVEGMLKIIDDCIAENEV